MVITLTEPTLELSPEQNAEPEIFAAFIDAIGRPIADLKIKLDTGDNVLELTTDSNGALPVINFGQGKPKGKIYALLPNGKEEVALKFELTLGLSSYTCESPYVLIPGKTFKHEGVPSSQIKGEKQTPLGSIKDKRSLAGNPVKECTVHDCPNSDNLKLCPNHQYKQFILNAAKHGDMIPQGVAALINTEAGRVVYEYEMPVLNKKGKPVLNKDGVARTKKVKVTSKEWLPTATNSRSTARGLTQFLAGSWKGQALLRGSYLNLQAMSRGYVVEVVKKIKRSGKPKVTVEEQESKYLVIKNEGKLLSMRDDPEMSIMVSVDYGVQNFKTLLQSDVKLAGINSSEKAKLFYLMHHLGFGDARSFIKNKLKDARAKQILTDQIGSQSAEEKALQEMDNSYMLAHRRWLIGFIDSHITPKNFACNQAKIADARTLFELIVAVGGSHPDKFTV